VINVTTKQQKLFNDYHLGFCTLHKDWKLETKNLKIWEY